MGLMLAGYIMIIGIVVLLIKEKASLPPIFILIPIAGALLCGFPVSEVCGFIAEGIRSVTDTALLFLFSILYFSILGETGVFDVLAHFLLRHMRNNIYLFLMLTFGMAALIQLDGSGAMTMLIVIPMMLPLYDAMNIRRTSLVCACAVGTGVMNMFPWCSAMLRISAGTGLEAQMIWREVLPVQTASFLIAVFVIILMGWGEKRRGAGIDSEEFERLKEENARPVSLKVSRLTAGFDVCLTIILILLMLLDVVTAGVGFMAGVGILLVTNYSSMKKQDEVIKRFSSTAYPLALTIFLIGVMLGIMKGMGAIDAMAQSLVGLLPEGWGAYAVFLYGLAGVPVSMVLGSDCCYSLIAPLLGTISQHYGGGMMNAAIAVILSSSMAASISFTGPVPYMTVGLAGISMNENVKYSFRYLWIMGILMIVTARMMGIV